MQVMERGTKAFVAYVRGYKEHHCKFVFQLADLDLSHLGHAFGLLRLPAMKEVRPPLLHPSPSRPLGPAPAVQNSYFKQPRPCPSHTGSHRCWTAASPPI